MSNAADVSQLTLDSDDLVEEVITDGSIQTDAIVERQGDVEREALEVAIGIDVVIQLEIAEELVDARHGLKIYKGQVCLHGLSIQGSGSSLACTLHRVIPWRGTECKDALCLGDDLVKGPELGA